MNPKPECFRRGVRIWDLPELASEVSGARARHSFTQQWFPVGDLPFSAFSHLHLLTRCRKCRRHPHKEISTAAENPQFRLCAETQQRRTPLFAPVLKSSQHVVCRRHRCDYSTGAVCELAVRPGGVDLLELSTRNVR